MKAKDLWSAILAAALFLVLLLIFHWNVLADAAVSVIVYFALTFLLKPTKKIGGVDVESIHGGEALGETMDEAKDNLRRIQKAALFMRSRQLQDDALKMADTARQIIRYLEGHVEQIPQGRRFMTYYLDTAAAILSRYVEFQNNSAPEKDMKRISDSTEAAVRTLQETFESLYSRLLQGEVMDMEVDVDVLKNIADTDLKDKNFHVEVPHAGGEKAPQAADSAVQGMAASCGEAVQTAPAQQSKEEED